MQRVTSALVVLAVLASCTSSDGPLSDSTIPPNPPVTDAETAVAPATAAQTTTPPTPDTTTTAPTTSPSSPPAGDDTIEQEIIDAVEALEQSWKQCMAAVPNCDLDLVRRGRGGEFRADMISTAQGFGLQGFEVRDADQIEFNVDNVDVAPDGLTANVTMCLEDASVLVRPSDDGDVVLNDNFISARYSWDFERIEGEWIAVRRVQIDDFIEGREGNLCAS